MIELVKKASLSNTMLKATHTTIIESENSMSIG